MKPPLRMGIFTAAGGTVRESWRPKETGPLGKLPSILRALEPLKDEILIVSGLSHGGSAVGLNAHEHAAYLHLTGAPEVRKVDGKMSAGVSVDQVAAQAVGGATVLPSLEIGETSHETRFSWRASDQPMPFEFSPRQIFERMFHGRKVTVPDWSRPSATPGPTTSGKRPSEEQSIIDFVLEDANRLAREVGAKDRHRVEEYLDSVRAVERRVRVVEGFQRQATLDSGSSGRSKPNLPSLPEGALEARMQNTTGLDPGIHAEYIQLLSDLMILAFQTDTTRVLTFAVGSDEALFPGIVTVGYERHAHTLEHQGNADPVENADPIAREACRQIHAWYTGLFAQMIRKMKAIDEGGSSLLDNCMILYTSYMADGGHGRDDYPALLAGRAQGTIKTGRHLAFPKGTPVSNLYLEMLSRMGVKLAAFGESHSPAHAAFEGRLPGLS